MKKIFYTIILTVFIFSCGPHFENNKGGEIHSIRRHGSGCDYAIRYDGEFMHLIDTCGKYKIGDTLYFAKTNKQ